MLQQKDYRFTEVCSELPEKLGVLEWKITV